MIVASDIFAAENLKAVVTSATSGVHGVGSLHYLGLAFDLRTKDLSLVTAQYLKDKIKAALGDEFDVILETNPPHLHVEYDPKKAINT